MTALPSQNVQQNVRGLSRLGTVTPVVASTKTYVGSVCPHLHPINHHVPANVPRPLPLDSVTPVVISLLIFVVPVFQLVPESVRMPSGQETVTQVVMPTLTFVENVSPSTQHQPQPQQLFVCVRGNVRQQLPLETVIQAVASTMTFVENVYLSTLQLLLLPLPLPPPPR